MKERRWLSQLRALLIKNLQLKWADRYQTVAEIALPVLFMALLVWIKSITTAFDSSNVAYVCGQAKPFQYTEHLTPTASLVSCLTKPDVCTTPDYYRDDWELAELLNITDVYTGYGFMSAGDRYPFYSFTVADTSSVYQEAEAFTGFSVYNPSLDLQSIAQRMRYRGQRSFIAVAPKDGASTATVAAAADLARHLTDSIGGSDSPLAQVVRSFASESALEALVRSSDYDTSGGQKVGFAVVLNDAPTLVQQQQQQHQQQQQQQQQQRTAVPDSTTTTDSSVYSDSSYVATAGATSTTTGAAYHSTHSITSSRGSSSSSSSRGSSSGTSSDSSSSNSSDASTANSWDYTLRFNFTYAVDALSEAVPCLYSGCSNGGASSVPGTRTAPTEPLLRPPTSRYTFGYGRSGFLTVQQAVDEFILSRAAGAGQSVKLQSSFGFMPERAYFTDQFQEVIASTLGIFYMLAFLYPVSRMIRLLVTEKETRIKEGMKMMGLSDPVYHLSWFIIMLLQLIITDIAIVVLTRNSVFQYSNKSLLFFWLLSVSLAIIAFCFLVATFFSRAKTAATLGSILFFGTFFPYFYVGGPNEVGVTPKTFASLLVPTALALGGDTFAAWEGGLVGVQHSNAFESYDSNLSYAAAVSLLLLDAALYTALAWYLDKVLPAEYGTQLPWWFPVSRGYWNPAAAAPAVSGTSSEPFGKLGSNGSNGSTSNRRNSNSHDRGSRLLRLFSFGKRSTAAAAAAVRDDSELAEPLLEQQLLPVTAGDSSSSSRCSGTKVQRPSGKAKIEPVSADLQVQIQEGRCVSMRGLRKVYDNGKVAVEGLDLDLFEGQISVLLGQNGAGKSTTIAMLAGLTPATAGSTSVRGIAVCSGAAAASQSLQQLRQHLGVCPQHDILFPQLTVMQHLLLYAAVKGVAWGERAVEAKKLAVEVGLGDKLTAASCTLSGGQKRKLSVAIALIGGSSVVILDEPTSGMDPHSRRATWRVLQRHREGRVMLLSTHFLDEADILADRIAIMADGKLQCAGSSLFLKNTYGVGYTLTVVLGGHISNYTSGTDVTADSDPVARLVLEYVPTAHALSSAGAERSFRLPFPAAPFFPALLDALDAQGRTELGVTAFGLSVTTLEEVFLRVGADVSETVGTAVEPAVGTEASHSSNNSSSSSSSGSSSSTDEVVSVQGAWQRSQQQQQQQRLSLLQTAASKGQLQAFEQEGAGSSETEKVPLGGWRMFITHFAALFRKRLIYGLRDKKSIVFQLVIPVVLFLLGLSLLRAGSNAYDQPALPLTPNSMFNTKLPAAARNPTPVHNLANSTLAAAIENSFLSGSQLQTRGIPVLAPDSVQDQFAGCAQGGAPLVAMSNFLLGVPQSAGELGATRYGAVTLAADTGSDVSSNVSTVVYNVLVNASAKHAAPVFASLVHSAALQAILANTTTAATSGSTSSSKKQQEAQAAPTITTRSAPLPKTRKQEEAKAALDAFTTAMMVVIAFCFIPASYAIVVVKEREVKAKHQQMISGVSAVAYWSSTYAFDALSYLVPALLCLGLIYAFHIPAYTAGASAGAAAALLLLYGPAVAPFTYAVSFAFSSHSAAQNAVLLLNFLTGLALMVTSFVLSLLDNTRMINAKLKWVYRLFPGFCLGDGLAQLVLCTDDNCPKLNSVTGFDLTATQGPWAWQVAGADVAFLIAESLVYFLITLAIEYALAYPALAAMLQRGAPPPNPQDPADDPDVAAETLRVISENTIYKSADSNSNSNGHVQLDEESGTVYSSSSSSGDAVRIVQLRKVYPGGKEAVRQLSLGIPRGQCFGLLGVNGAGKTTLLSMLSGDTHPSSGSATICGFDVATQQPLLRRRVGYCPQFDALLELLSVREHIELYARIKGLSSAAVAAVTRASMQELGLTQFEHVRSGQLSGGNKRKLSLAIALVGEPEVMFLDEPSTGMDPLAKRKMWHVLSKLTTGPKARAVILTSHALEEVSALSSRIGIMRGGRLRCIGSEQHLKERFGNGFELDVKTALADDAQLQRVADTLHSTHTVSAAQLDSTRVQPPFARVCVPLATTFEVAGGLQLLQQALAPGGSGHHLTDVAASENGSVSLRLLCDWFCGERSFLQLQAFVTRAFPGVETVERRSLHSVRYSIPKSSGMSLALVFRELESAKSSIGIAEYSVGQQTLESIFNSFAARQDIADAEQQQ